MNWINWLGIAIAVLAIAIGTAAGYGSWRWKLGTDEIRARLEAAAVPVRVHDAYVAGDGLLHGAVLGLVSVVAVDNTTELARGELIRFFAEAVWYPTALLPSQAASRTTRCKPV